MLKEVFDGMGKKYTLSNEERFREIEDDIADLQYDPISITELYDDVGTVELGQPVTEMTVTWKLNKDPVMQTLGGEAISVIERRKTVSMEGRTSVTLVVTDERGATDEAKAGYNAYNGVYYGLMDDGGVVDSVAILALYKRIQSNRNVTFVAEAKVGKRVAYAIPTTYGTPTFKDADSGFKVDMYLADTVEFTNKYGYTTAYNVWLATNILTKKFSIAVT